MLDRPEGDDLRARIAEVESRRIPFGEIARWFGPWVLAGALVAMLIAGLWFASDAVDDGAYAVGLAAAAFALAALVWEVGIAFGGGARRLSGTVFVEDDATIVILLALLAVLAVGGLVLAARTDSVATIAAGYGLCVAAILLAAANLKHYFDRREEDEAR